MKKGVPLMAFPEGKRSKDGRLMEFKGGLFSMAVKTKVPIVPITIPKKKRQPPPMMPPNQQTKKKPRWIGRIVPKFTVVIFVRHLGNARHWKKLRLC